MNAGHDLGGMMGFGPIDPVEDEPKFAQNWERRVFALTLAASVPGGWTLDNSRYARESLPPPQYLNSSYYEIWLAGLEKLTVEHNLLDRRELTTGQVLAPPKPGVAIMDAERVEKLVFVGAPTLRPATAAARFDIGAPVRARNLQPPTHTRLPGYIRGHAGTVRRLHGCHVFPDSNAHGEGENPKFLYCVEFTAAELWGDDGANNQSVMVDLWEPYLEPAK
jgi:nitrile hydratase beta subunit